jgi:hypothetical protein
MFRRNRSEPLTNLFFRHLLHLRYASRVNFKHIVETFVISVLAFFIIFSLKAAYLLSFSEAKTQDSELGMCERNMCEPVQSTFISTSSSPD